MTLAIAPSFDPVFDSPVQHNNRAPRVERLPTLSITVDGRWVSMTVPERVKAIKERFALGWDVRATADWLGASRNAVVGVCLRNDIAIPRASSGSSPFAAAAPEPLFPKAWIPLAGSTPKSMMDTGETDCMWPVDVFGAAEQMFCAEPRHLRGRYCEHHHKASLPRHAPAPEKLPTDHFTKAMEPSLDESFDTAVEDVVIDLGVEKKREEV